MDHWAIVIVALILSAFFSGMEIAFVSSNNLRIEIDKSKGLLSGRILSFFNNNPSRFVASLLLGNNIALVIYGIAMANILEPFITGFLPGVLDNEFTVLIIQILMATVLILITAEFLPKVLFRINPNATLNIFALPVLVFYAVFYPLIYIFTGISRVLLRLFWGIRSGVDRYAFSSVDLIAYVKSLGDNEHEDVEQAQEFQMFRNAIEFKTIKLRECMVPRTEIEAIEESDSIENLKKKFTSTGFSKIPVYRESIDNIIGYIHHSDMFRKPENISAVTRPVMYVPETMLANNVLSTFIHKHKSIAVVVDEFGGTSGLVTLEDLIEEIFGEIEDEYDAEELVEKEINPDEYIFSGRLEIDYLNENYAFDLPESEDYETLAGLIISHHESIPERNQEILIGHFRFTILQSSGNRIDQIHLKLTD